MSGHQDDSRLTDSTESPHEDRELADAFRAIRDKYDGEHDAADLTLQRALFQARVHRRRQRFTRWVLLPAAAVLVASTAWAGVTGRLAPTVRMMLDAIYEGPSRDRSHGASGTPAAHTRPAESSSERSSSPAGTAPLPDESAAVAANDPPPSATEAIAPATPSEGSTPPSTRAPSATASVVGAVSARRPDVVAPAPSALEASAPTPAATTSAPDPHAALFAEAHRIHFGERDPARALAAWDRYLSAAPNGRFAPEARYNRALALVRLGRTAEARQELTAFADGLYGEYRRADAQALLDALARDAGR